MDCIVRVNLKTNTKTERSELVDYCLKKDRNRQYIAIGWSCVYLSDSNEFIDIKDFDEYYYAVKDDCRSYGKRMNPALNVFYDVEENDLLWTRDLEGFYWICRAKGKAEVLNQAGIDYETATNLDIGSVIPVEAYKYGLEVPGAIKASFNRPRGGTTQRIKDELMVCFSMSVYNQLSNTNTYKLKNSEELRAISESNFISNLPDFELEELVISYIQIKYNYYLLSNSIASKSTTIKIECEFYSRDKGNISKAVVQVKGPKYNRVLSATEFQEFLDNDYKVFLYANECDTCGNDNVIHILPKDLEKFYGEYKCVLPESIRQWENIFLKS